MTDDEPIFPGAQARITADFADFDKPSMGPADVLSVTVTITGPDGAALVTDAPMTWSAAELLWFYKWTTPGDSAGKTFQYTATLTALDNGKQPVDGVLWVQPRQPLLDLPDVGQPLGVPPASQHYVKPWCTEADLPAGRLKDSNGKRIEDLNLGWCIGAATDLLYVLSGRKFRWGRSIIRPSTRIRTAYFPAVYPYSSAGAWSGYGTSWGFPAGWAWSVFGMGWQLGGDETELHLQAPIRRINSVFVDGVQLTADQYVVYNRRRLSRVAGGVWPVRQDPSQPYSSVGTCLVDYEWGRSPKDIGRMACAELSIELALAFSGQDDCKLSPRTVSVASEGVTVQTGTSIDYLKEDLTGLPIVDAFLRAENPTKRRRPGVFLSPSSVLNRST